MRKDKPAVDTMVPSPSRSAAYWNAVAHRVPPALTTTLGNYTCVNSITRFSYTMAANQYTQLAFGFTGSALRAWLWAATALTNASGILAWQQQQLNSSNTQPLDVRPLRMSIKIRNTTQNLNVAGAVTSSLIPQSLLPTFSAASTQNAATTANQWNLVQADPHARTFSGVELQKSHTFVMPPSSFVAYNSYKDWIGLSATSDNGGSLTAADFGLLFGISGLVPTYPFTPATGWMADIPTNYILLVNFEPNSLAQSFEFEVFCQDGVRYPAYSAIASMASSHQSAKPLTEANVQRHASVAAENYVHPSDSIATMGEHLMSAASGVGTIMQGASLARTISRTMSGASSARGIANALRLLAI